MQKQVQYIKTDEIQSFGTTWFMVIIVFRGLETAVGVGNNGWAAFCTVRRRCQVFLLLLLLQIVVKCVEIGMTGRDRTALVTETRHKDESTSLWKRHNNYGFANKLKFIYSGGGVSVRPKATQRISLVSSGSCLHSKLQGDFNCCRYRSNLS